MEPKDPIEALGGRWTDGTRPKDVYALYVSKDPRRYAPRLVECLRASTGKQQSGCAELVTLLSEDHPELLYPYIDLFEANLSAKPPVLRWEAVATLGNLARVDSRRRLPSLISAIGEHLHSDSIVLQNHAVHTLAKIAAAYPGEASGILETLTGVTGLFPENRVGFIVEVMEQSTDPSVKPEAISFLEGYVDHPVSVVAAKARKTLKKLKA